MCIRDSGEISNGYMLLMHAEDQLMSAEAFRILADEFITLYKKMCIRDRSYGIPINMYDSKSAGAESYRNLAKEIRARKDI